MTNWKKELATAQLVRHHLARVSAGLWPFDVPRAPATEAELDEVERRLAVPLDSEHRAFLLHANGWPAFYKDVDLFGGPELGASPQWDRACRVLDAAIPIRDEAGQEYPRAGLVPIAAARSRPAVFALMTCESACPGAVLWIHDGVVQQFPSFSEFFLSMLDYARSSIVRFEQEPRR